MNNDFDFENLAIEVGEITTITIARPEALNALDSHTLLELAQAFDFILEETESQALIITGEGDKAFAAGADIREFEKIEDVFAGREYSLGGQEVIDTLAALPIPTIAAINGFALGGGLELALACDLRVASKSAKFGQPEVGLGLIPGFGGTQRLPRLIGMGRALDLILTGRQVGAEEALSMGLTNRLADNAVNEAQALAKLIIKNGPLAISLAKESIRRGLDIRLADALEIESDLFGLAMVSKDRQEGVRAFLEKRTPKFEGN